MILSPQTIIVIIGHSINAVISTALLMLVLWQAPRLRSNQIFALMMLCLSAYSLLNIFGRFLQPLELEPKPVYELTIIFYILFVTLLFFFAADFAELRGRAARGVKILDVVANALSILAIFSNLVFAGVYPLPDNSGGFSYRAGPLFAPVIIAHLLYLFLIILVLYRAKEPLARLLWPAVALILGGTVSLTLRPFLPLPLNAVLLAIASLWMGYIILRHQLFNPLARLNRELAEANRLKSQFLANMSHELRTPLNSIIGYTNLIAEGLYGPVTERQHDRLIRVIHNGQHLLGLINDILDLSKIEAGQMVLNTTRLDTPELLESVLATMEPLAQDKDLTIRRDFAGAPPIMADETRIRQIFVNLLANAIKFTSEGTITIHAGGTSADGVVHFQVSDTGIGIPEDKLDVVFEEFRQVDESATRQYQGTGLGLAITRRLVEMHGGQITVESEVGAGTTFHLTLPAADSAAASSDASGIGRRYRHPIL